MDNRLINLSILLNDYKLQVYDLVSIISCETEKNIKEKIFCDVFIDVFKSIRNVKEKLPLHLMIYNIAKNQLCKSKFTKRKKEPNIKEFTQLIDIGNIHPVDISNVDIIELIEYLDPKDRLLAVMSLRHNLNTNELSTVYKTSVGAINTRLSVIKTTLIRLAIKKLNNVKESSKSEDPKICYPIKKSEVQYSLGTITKEEQSKISRHISKCTSCKNFYIWNQKITELLMNAQTDTLSSNINNTVFKRLEKKAIDDTALHHVRTNWKTRISISLILIIVILAGYYFSFYKKAQHTQVRQTQNTPQAIKTNDTASIIINFIQDKGVPETTKTELLETATMFSIRTIQDPVMAENGALNYEFEIPRNNKDQFIEKLKQIKGVSTNENIPDDQEIQTLKVEMTIYPNE
ncbi:MAG TPA: hypothetical protein PK443_01720 [bacterium]|nr:hypothetical protein [bacterium]